MNLFEMLAFMILSAAMLALGHFLSGRWGTAGWLVGVVPVGVFWAYVLFSTIKATIMELWRHKKRGAAQEDKRAS